MTANMATGERFPQVKSEIIPIANEPIIAPVSFMDEIFAYCLELKP